MGAGQAPVAAASRLARSVPCTQCHAAQGLRTPGTSQHGVGARHAGSYPAATCGLARCVPGRHSSGRALLSACVPGSGCLGCSKAAAGARAGLGARGTGRVLVAPEPLQASGLGQHQLGAGILAAATQPGLDGRHAQGGAGQHEAVQRSGAGQRDLVAGSARVPPGRGADARHAGSVCRAHAHRQGSDAVQRAVGASADARGA
mmetsp:Transcript_1570/g.4195  ORF Transcript_1570/g.4195 Transcript_1570/m.4195 type:complete len:203 (-) Transcript_1570:2470-3078(-)